MKLRMISLMKSRTSLKMGHVGSKIRLLGQMLEKSCVRSRGHIFSQIIIKLGQNFCLNEMDEYENGSKLRLLGQILEKLCVCSRDQIVGLTLTKLGQSVCLDEILDIFFKNASCWVKKWVTTSNHRRLYGCNQRVVI